MKKVRWLSAAWEQTDRGELFPSAKNPEGEPATGGIGAVPGVPGTKRHRARQGCSNRAQIGLRQRSGWCRRSRPRNTRSGFEQRCALSRKHLLPVESSDSTSGESKRIPPRCLRSPRSLGMARKNSFARPLECLKGPAEAYCRKGNSAPLRHSLPTSIRSISVCSLRWPVRYVYLYS